MNADKTTATNNSIVYNYAPSESLMNDRLGGTTTDYDAGNIRYYGANPNNYIYYNCTDYSNQNDSTCEKWRIIGVMKDIKLADGITTNLVKITRDSSIGKYTWDNKDAGGGMVIYQGDNGSNNWPVARLMMLLNPGYTEKVYGINGVVLYNFEGSLYWNAKSGTCYYGYNGIETIGCDFRNTGLQNDITKNIRIKNICQYLIIRKLYDKSNIDKMHVDFYER